ncbi:MAG: SHOCT domain-containing protein [Pseudomonadota bacterium]
MTAILKDLRDLEAQRKRGELTDGEYAQRRADMLRSIEVAESEFDAAPAAPPRGRGASALSFGFVLTIGVMGLCVGATLLVLPDLNLALTLGVTILAALSVALLRDLEE